MSLMEMLVGMVLLMIIGAIVSRGLVDGLVRSQHADSTQSATISATALAAQMGNDLRSMSMRETSPLIRNYDLPQLRQQVLLGPGLNDLRVATGDQVTFVADVVGPQAVRQTSATTTRGEGPECVTYALAATGELHRTITRFIDPGSPAIPRCDTVPLSDAVVLSARPAIGRTAPPIFSYRLRSNPNPTKDPLNPDDCVTTVPATPPADARTRGFVTAIDIDLRAYGDNRSVIGEHSLQSTVAIRARLSHDYQYALGCSY